MSKARKRKDTQFNSKMSKCVFLYGEPTNDKAVKIKKMQAEFVKLINNYIKALNDNTKITLQLVKSDNKDSQMRAFEKSIRPEKVNASYCQNAFDMAVIHLSNRLDNIRLDMCRECKSIFTTSKVLFAMSIDGRSKTEMITAIPYAYEEYDGNWMMCDEAEEMEAYKKDIKKNEKLLPVSIPINSYMWTGDKFSTWYSGVYEIAIEGDMTKEYAKELAKKFAK